MKVCLIKNAALVLVAWAASFCACAHEFWIAANPSAPAVAAPTTLTLNVGEYYTGERVGVTTSHAVSLHAVSAGGTRDLTPLVPSEPMLPSLDVAFSEAGSHVLAYESHPSQVVLPAEKWHAYLHDEGLDAIVKQREAAGTAGTPGRERFRRSAKTLVRVGPQADGASMRSAGQRFEMTPQTDPLAAAAGEALRFVLTFEGQPRAGVLVKAWHKLGRQTTTLRTTTDARGGFVFTLPFAGVWMFNAVHMVAATDSPDVDWDSYWSSLTFDLPPRK